MRAGVISFGPMERLSITHGMRVKGHNGEVLGIVDRCGEEHVLLRPRNFSHERFAMPYRAIKSLDDGYVWLSGGKELLIDPHQPDLESGITTTIKPVPPGLFQGTSTPAPS
jgi:hypothetical protein